MNEITLQTIEEKERELAALKDQLRRQEEERLRAAEEAARKAAEPKAIAQTRETACAMVSDAIMNGRSISVPIAGDRRASVRDTSVRATPKDTVALADVLNMGGNVFEIGQEAFVRAVAEWWQLSLDSKSFGKLTFFPLFRSLQSMNSAKGCMTEKAHRHLAPVSKALLRRNNSRRGRPVKAETAYESADIIVVETATAQPKPITLGDVRDALVKYGHITTPSKARELVIRCGGAESLAALPPEKYQCVYDAAQSAT